MNKIMPTTKDEAEQHAQEYQSWQADQSLSYAQIADWQDAYEQLGDGSITDKNEQKQFIDERTQTYEFDGGLIVQDF